MASRKVSARSVALRQAKRRKLQQSGQQARSAGVLGMYDSHSNRTDEGCSAWRVGNGLHCVSVPEDYRLLTIFDRIVILLRQCQENVEIFRTLVVI